MKNRTIKKKHKKEKKSRRSHKLSLPYINYVHKIHYADIAGAVLLESLFYEQPYCTNDFSVFVGLFGLIYLSFDLTVKLV